MNCVCGYHLFKVNEKVASNGIKHVGAYCGQCDKWLRWLPAEAPAAEKELTAIGDIPIPFGKYAGTKLKDLPAEYLNYMERQSSSVWKSRAASVLSEIKERKQG